MTASLKGLDDSTRRQTARLFEGRVLVAGLLASPAIVAPILIIGNMIWARFQFEKLHPEDAAIKPPTISKALTDTAIGDVFAVWMVVGVVLLAFAIWRVSRIYLASISSRFAWSERNKARARKVVAGVCILQAIANVGMLLLSWYPSDTDALIHMIGSYMLFFGHAVSILMSGMLCGALSRTARAGSDTDLRHGLTARNCAFRSRFSRVIAVLAAIFWIVYLNRDATLPIDSFTVQLIFSSLELVVIVSFLSYLASFAPDLFRYELNGSSHAERL